MNPQITQMDADNADRKDKDHAIFGAAMFFQIAPLKDLSLICDNLRHLLILVLAVILFSDRATISIGNFNSLAFTKNRI